MKALVVTGFVLLTLLVIGAGLALGAVIIYFLGNVILNHFGLEPLTPMVAFAISVLLWFIGSLFKSGSSK